MRLGLGLVNWKSDSNSKILRSESLASQFECSQQNEIRLPVSGKAGAQTDSDHCVSGKFLLPGTVTETVCVRSSCSRLGNRCDLIFNSEQ